MITAACGRTEQLIAPPAPPPPPPTPPLGLATVLFVYPSQLSILLGEASQVTARAFDSLGRPVTVEIHYLSANPAIARVGTMDGWVTAVKAGSTTVTATTGSLSATAAVGVAELAGTIGFTRMATSESGSVSFEILLHSIQARSTLPLTHPAQFTSLAAPSWSPDGTLLALEVIATERPVIFTDEGMIYTSDLYVLDAENPGRLPWRPLTSHGGGRWPSWSPDGTRIAYFAVSDSGTRGHILVTDASGGSFLRVTNIEASYGKPSWSPDGVRLAVSDGVDIFLVNADGTGSANLTEGAGWNYDPSWSPDGSRLAFVSERPTGYGVFVTGVDGSHLTQLTNLPRRQVSAPMWSPDGNLIVFAVSGALGDSPGLYVITASGSAPVRLTTPGLRTHDKLPVWR